MKLTALEIKQQKFETSFRGYEPAEVQSFLKLVSNEWEHLMNRNKELEQQIEELREKIKHFERVEEALHETLKAAKETSDNKKMEAHKEAAHTIEKAEMEAEAIVRDAAVQRQTVRQDIRRLLDRRKEIVGGLRSYLDVALESVENFANDDTGLYKMPAKSQEEKKDTSESEIKPSASSVKSDKSSSVSLDQPNIDDLVDDLE